MKIVVLSPHRDDAAFSISLSIALWLEDGHTVQVMNCFTQSAYAPFDNTKHTLADWQTIADMRAREDMVWRDRLEANLRFKGNLVITDMQLWDAPLRLSCSEDCVCELPVDPNDKSIESIAEAVRQASGDALIFPLGLGHHVDHLTTMSVYRAVDSAAQIVAFYEDLPYAARPGVAETIEEAVLGIDPRLTGAYVAGGSDEVIAVQSKLQYAGCYPTQIDQQVAEQIAAFSKRYHGRERLWVDGARPGSEKLFWSFDKRMSA